jgi:hypothetical protein
MIKMTIFIPKHVQLTKIKGKCVILDSQKNFFYAISKSGAEFLDQINTHGSMEKAIKAISEVYNISQDRLEKDMGTFLNQLIERGLILKQ